MLTPLCCLCCQSTACVATGCDGRRPAHAVVARGERDACAPVHSQVRRSAPKNAISRASKTVRDMKWFEVVQTRGHIEDNQVRHYQVTLRVGFTLEE